MMSLTSFHALHKALLRLSRSLDLPKIEIILNL